MDWQEVVVGGIGIVVGALLLRRIVCLLRRRTSDCGKCGADCPLKEIKRKHKRPCC